MMLLPLRKMAHEGHHLALVAVADQRDVVADLELHLVGEQRAEDQPVGIDAVVVEAAGDDLRRAARWRAGAVPGRCPGGSPPRVWKSPRAVTLPCTMGAQAITLENCRATRMISAASVMPS